MKEKWQNQHDTKEAPWDYNEFDVDFKEELLSLSSNNKTVIDVEMVHKHIILKKWDTM